MDLSSTIEPNSDQVNAEDLIAGPQTVTITGVEAGTADQPVFIHLAEFPGRTYYKRDKEGHLELKGGKPIYVGPLKDNKGVEKVAAGAEISADDLQAINWLVEGVI